MKTAKIIDLARFRHIDTTGSPVWPGSHAQQPAADRLWELLDRNLKIIAAPGR